jgi:hypothetical protein
MRHFGFQTTRSVAGGGQAILPVRLSRRAEIAPPPAFNARALASGSREPGFDLPEVDLAAPALPFDAPELHFEEPTLGFVPRVLAFAAPALGFTAPVLGFVVPVLRFVASEEQLQPRVLPFDPVALHFEALVLRFEGPEDQMEARVLAFDPRAVREATRELPRCGNVDAGTLLKQEEER